MNGIPVCFFSKTENAPTQGPPKANFGTPVLPGEDHNPTPEYWLFLYRCRINSFSLPYPGTVASQLY